MPQYTIGQFSFYDAVPSEDAIRVSSINIPTNADVSTDDTGEIFDQAHSLVGWAPEVTVTSKSIDKVLSYIGITGQCVGSGQAVTQCDAFGRRLQTCKDTFGASSHMRYRVVEGLLVLGSLTAERNADASIDFMLHTFTDGTNAPVQETDGVALPSSVTGTRFRLGQCSIGGVEMSELESVQIDFGVSLTPKEPALGAIYPESLGVLMVRPEITLRGRDLAKIKAAVFPLGASATTHVNTKIQLIKLEDSGSFVDFATAEHITLSAAGMLTPEQLMTSSVNSRSTNELRLRTIDDGTNAPIIHSLGAYDTTPITS